MKVLERVFNQIFPCYRLHNEKHDECLQISLVSKYGENEKPLNRVNSLPLSLIQRNLRINSEDGTKPYDIMNFCSIVDNSK